MNTTPDKQILKKTFNLPNTHIFTRAKTVPTFLNEGMRPAREGVIRDILEIVFRY